MSKNKPEVPFWDFPPENTGSVLEENGRPVRDRNAADVFNKLERKANEWGIDLGSLKILDRPELIAQLLIDKKVAIVADGPFINDHDMQTIADAVVEDWRPASGTLSDHERQNLSALVYDCLSLNEGEEELLAAYNKGIKNKE